VIIDAADVIYDNEHEINRAIQKYKECILIIQMNTLLITPQIRHVGMLFLSVFEERVDGSNSTFLFIKKFEVS
jgi:hypothetical protein